jgi:hypothetical protein
MKILATILGKDQVVEDQSAEDEKLVATAIVLEGGSAPNQFLKFLEKMSSGYNGATLNLDLSVDDAFVAHVESKLKESKEDSTPQPSKGAKKD